MEDLKRLMIEKLISWKKAKVLRFSTRAIYEEFPRKPYHIIFGILQDIEKESNMIQVLYEICCPECYRTLLSLTLAELDAREYQELECVCGNEFELLGDEELDSRQYSWRFI